MSKKDKTPKVRNFKPGLIRVLFDIALLLLGIALIIWPVDAAVTFTRVFGIVIVACALFQVISFIRNKERDIADMISIFGAVILGIAGVFLIVNPGWLVNFFNIVFGVLIIIYGLVNLINAIIARKLQDAWFIPLIMAIVAIGMGVVIILVEFAATKALMYVIGGTLVFASITGIVNAVRLSKVQKMMDQVMKDITPVSEDEKER